MPDAPPSGFVPVAAISGFLELLGPIWANDAIRTLAWRIAPQHLNRFDQLHGGAFAAFADLQALTLERVRPPPAPQVRTVTLTTDFMAPVAVGDWLTMTVALTRETRSLLFTDATLRVGARQVGRASGIYMKVDGATPARPDIVR